MLLLFIQANQNSGIGIQEHSPHHSSAAMLKSHSIDDILGLKAAAAVHAARAVAALAVTRHNEMVHLNGLGNVRPQLVTSSSNISNSTNDSLKHLFEARPPSCGSPPSTSSSSNVKTAHGTHLEESQYLEKGKFTMK